MRTTTRAWGLAILAWAGGLTLSATGPVFADLREAFAGVFESGDVNGSGWLSRAEYLHFQELFFLQIDDNEDDYLGADEWNNWDPRSMGVEYEPAEIGKVYAVMARAFVGLDHDSDGRLTRTELVAGLFGSFTDADEGNDEVLSVEEFVGAYRLPTIVRNDFEEMFGAETAPAVNPVPAGTGIVR